MTWPLGRELPSAESGRTRPALRSWVTTWAPATRATTVSGPVAPPAGEREAGEDDHRQGHRGDADELEHPEALPAQAQVGGRPHHRVVEGPARRVEHGDDVGADHRGEPEHHGGDRGRRPPRAVPRRAGASRSGTVGAVARVVMVADGPRGGCGPADRGLCGA